VGRALLRTQDERHAGTRFLTLDLVGFPAVDEGEDKSDKDHNLQHRKDPK
jgi:hypothetical protein